ncbi:MAG: CRTAC1 family protein [Myxococcales bacterium]|nr:CRTAC1 family protein [Myxococcales bacterium]
MGLATEELKAGTVEAAQQALERAALVLADAPPEADARRELLLFLRGLAALRLGEQRGCREHHGPRSCILPLTGDAVHPDPAPARASMAAFQALADRTPPGEWRHHTSRWLLNIAAMAAGAWPDGLAPADRLTFPTAPFKAFPNVAGALGVDAYDHAGGALADDFDGDGRLDLISTSFHPAEPPRFWRADGAGGFVAEDAGLGGVLGGLHIVHGDYDGDGDLDLYLPRGAWMRAAGRLPAALLRNDGGRFTDVAAAVGLADAQPSQAAAWADCDGDGDLDLYVGVETEPGLPSSRLYRNDDGHFTDIAAAAGVTNDRYAKGVAWGDYDGDRWPDLYVSNLHGKNRLYHNRGDCTFEDVAAQAGVEGPDDSFATWFWDFDDDGHLDLWVGAYTLAGAPDHLAYVAASHTGDPHPAAVSRLYRGDGQGRFTDVAPAMGLAAATLPMGAGFGDVDQDGWQDVYLGTGAPELDTLVPNKLYRNVAGQRFEDVTVAAGVGHLQKGHGVVFADLDDDGDQDLWEQMGGFFENDAFFNALYENPGFGGHWIDVELRGRRSNRFGVGAHLFVEADGHTRHRVVGFGSSFGSRPLRENIGLGSATRITRLIVWWPATDERQLFTDVPVDAHLRIVESDDTLIRLARPATPLATGPR